MNLREAAQQALEALENLDEQELATGDLMWLGKEIGDLRAALAEDRSGDTGKTSDHFADAGEMVATINEMETVEPVAWRYTPSERLRDVVLTSDPSQARLAADYGCEVQPLYLAPPQRPAEPVAWTTKGQISAMENGFQHYIHGRVPRFVSPTEDDVPLYTAPPKRKPLTDDDIDLLRQGEQRLNFVTLREFRVIARAIERAHGIGGEE